MSTIEVEKCDLKRIRQGQLISNVEYIESYSEADGDFTLKILRFPLVMVMTQDCDLESAFRDRNSDDNWNEWERQLLSVLLVPLYNEEHLRAGKHLEELEISSDRLNGEKWRQVKINEVSRYHYFDFPDSISFPKSVADFKHYFSIHTRELVMQISRGSASEYMIKELYREQVCQRFAAYLSRIGLPDLGVKVPH